MTKPPRRSGVRGFFRLQLRSAVRASAEADDELTSFLEARIDDLVAGGMDPSAAREEAMSRLSAGGLEGARTSLRRSAVRREKRLHLREWLDNLVSDIRIAARVLWRERMHAAVVAFTLSLGIAAASATFAAADQILFRPLPMRAQNQLALLTVQNTALLDKHVGVSYGILSDLRTRSRAIESLAGVPIMSGAPYAVRDGDRVVQLALTATTANFFEVLGAVPARGRLLENRDDSGESGPVAVLSYEAWQRIFAARPDIVGHQIDLSAISFTVVGITPRGFDYPRGTDMWVSDLEYLRLSGFNAGPEDGYWDVLVRLRSSGTLTQASSELMSQIRTSKASTLGQASTRSVAGESLVDVLTGNQRDMLMLFAAAVALVLLVGCTNVAGLILARGLSRARELAVRKALGATPGRIVRQLMIENLILSIAGGVLGVLGANALLTLLAVLAPPELARMDQVHLDALDAGFAISVAFLTSILFGLAPAISAAMGSIDVPLRQEGRAQTGSTSTVRTRQLLVMCQVSLAVVMLTSAGLLIRNLARLERLDLGFEPRNLLFVYVAQLDSANSGDFQAGAARHNALIIGLIDRVKSIPGVVGATSTEAIPFSVIPGSGGPDVHFALEGASSAAGLASRKAGFNVASDDYFAILHTPLLRGRAFTTGDKTGSQQVAIVNATFAREAWPGRDAIGQRVRFLNEGVVGLSRVVVGVAADTRYHDLLTTRPEIFIPVYQTEPGTFIAIRTAGDPLKTVPLVRDALRGIDRNYGIAKAIAGGELLDAKLARPRFLAAIVTVLALAAAVLAAVGLFGVLSFSIRQRRHELGIRVALGATARNLRSLVLRDVARLTVGGVVIGLAAGIPSSAIVRHEIVGVSNFDPLSLVVVIALIAATVLAAAALPIARASRADPAMVMRE